MRKTLCVAMLAVAVLLALTAPARADGKGFALPAAAKVTTADQRSHSRG